MNRRRIALLVVATNRYKEYVHPLEQSVAQYFFPDDDVTVHLFTDDPGACPIDQGVHTWAHVIPSWGYPDATLFRYQIFNEHWNAIRDADYVYYCDADMRFVQTVADDALPQTRSGLVAVLHKYFIGAEGTFETRPESMAYVPPHYRRNYVVGGFNGGRAASFGMMSYSIAASIETDEKRGVRAVWFDESHLNAYLASVSIDEGVTLLGPEYCWPEEQPNPAARLLCLYKPEGFRD